jgi:hypothetical protein
MLARTISSFNLEKDVGTIGTWTSKSVCYSWFGSCAAFNLETDGACMCLDSQALWTESMRRR